MSLLLRKNTSWQNIELSRIDKSQIGSLVKTEGLVVVKLCMERNIFILAIKSLKVYNYKSNFRRSAGR